MEDKALPPPFKKTLGRLVCFFGKTCAAFRAFLLACSKQAALGDFLGRSKSLGNCATSALASTY